MLKIVDVLFESTQKRQLMIWFLIVFYCNRGWKKFRTFIASTFGIEPSSSTDTNNWITAIKTKLESLSLSLVKMKVKTPLASIAPELHLLTRCPLGLQQES